MTRGRPSEYNPEYIAKVDEYLAKHSDIVEAGRLKVQLPTVEEFALFIGKSVKTLYNWAAQHEDFLQALNKIVVQQKQRLINKGLSGDYNPTIAKLILSSNHGMSEKKQIDHTSGGERIGLEQHNAQDKEAVEDFHKRLNEQRRERVLKQAVIDGQIVQENTKTNRPKKK